MPRGIYKRTEGMQTGKHMKGRRLSKETKQKISKANMGKHYHLGSIPWNKGKKGKRKMGYLYLCADFLHYGHLRYIKNIKKECDFLIAGILVASAICEKKPPPLLPYKERAALVQSIRYIDKVVPQYTYSPLSNVKKYRPDVLIESTDHKEQSANDFVKSYGGRVIVFPYYNKISSSKVKAKIKEEIKNGNIKENI